MNVLLNLTSLKNTVQNSLMSIVLAGMVMSCQATTVTNGIEMGLAVATVPFDIAAHRYDYTDQKKTAAFCHLTTDAISLLNKTFFFCNNFRGQQPVRATAWDCRDYGVNGAWAVRDITRFFQHLKQYRKAENAIVNPDEDVQVEVEPVEELFNDDLFISFNQNFDTPLKPQEISRIAYAFHVVVLPSLRGLTALALALSQDDEAGDLNSQQGRCLATAAHSLIRMSQEYAELESGRCKKLVGAALFAHAIWLFHEVKEYKDHMQARGRQRQLRAAQEAREREQEARREGRLRGRLNELLAIPGQLVFGPEGECIACMDEKPLVQLPCGHSAQCRDCCIRQLHAAVNTPEHERDIAAEGCRNGDCPYHISDADVRNIIGDGGNLLIDEGTPDQLAVNGQELLQQWVRAALPLDALNHPMCHQCFLPHRAGQPCAEARLTADPNDLLLADDLVRNGAKVCPTKDCGYAFEKGGGCNWIRCAKCHNGFCWTCLQPDPHHTMRHVNGRSVNPCGCATFDRGLW